MKATFLNQARPLIISMIIKDNPVSARFAVKNSFAAGADAVGIQLCRLKKEYRTEDDYKTLFSSAGGRPIYITNYRYAENTGQSDEECMQGLMMGLKCGATMADIMGDTFDPSDMELTRNPEAIAKQKELIERIHDMGKEVLMSSHISRFVPADTVLEIALEQQSRGVDVVKIVTGANSDEEQIENLRITTLLKKELKVPFVFVSVGTHTKIHRMVGPMLGCMGYLCTLQYDETSVPTQPTVSAAKAVRDNFDYMPDLIDE